MQRAFAAGIASALLHATMALALVAPRRERHTRAVPIQIVSVVQRPVMQKSAVPPAVLSSSTSTQPPRALRRIRPAPERSPPRPPPPPPPSEQPVAAQAPSGERLAAPLAIEHAVGDGIPSSPPPSPLPHAVDAAGNAPAVTPRSGGASAVDTQGGAAPNGVPGRSAPAGGEATRSYAASHLAAIRDAIQSHLVYPLRARRMGWTGRVAVRFRVGPGGAVGAVVVVESSRVPVLDESAVESVRRAAPFAPPPSPIEIVVPVTFDLEE